MGAEIFHVHVPIERLCSLIIDHMSIKEMMQHSRAVFIFGLNNCSSEIVGGKAKIGNQMLCFAIQGTQFQQGIFSTQQ